MLCGAMFVAKAYEAQEEIEELKTHSRRKIAMKFTAEMLNTVHDELLRESSEIIKDPEALQSQHYLELMADSEPEICADLLDTIEHYQEAMPLAFTLGGVDGLNAIVRDVAVLVAVTMLRLHEVADR